MALRGWFVGLMCLPLLGVVGCSDDDPKADPDPTPSVTAPSPTESRTPHEPVQPEPPAAMDGFGPSAVRAFVRFYWDVVNNAQLTGDTWKLKSPSVEICGPCDAGVDSIETVYSAGGHMRGGQFTVEHLQLFRVRGGKRPVFQVDVDVKVTKQLVVPREGAQRAHNKGGSSSMRMLISRDQSRDWQISQWEHR